MRAALVTGAFAAAGLVFAVRRSPDQGVLVPLGLSYAVLVAHTYRSLRCFSAIIPRNLRDQQAVDYVLGAAYVALASSLSDPVRFAAVAALLFAVATLKYALLLGRLGVPQLLARKIRVDALGTVAAVLAFIVASVGHGHAVAWTLFGLQVVANLHLLWWKPLYRRVPSPVP